jgi:hypothetical protein
MALNPSRFGAEFNLAHQIMKTPETVSLRPSITSRSIKSSQMAGRVKKMAANAAVDRNQPGVVEAQFARVASAGTARHPQLASLLADAVHLLCHLYGRHPGLTDLVVQSGTACGAATWVKDAAESFERERLYLVRLTSAVGPQPSTAGSAQTESAIAAQRHALETLATSERKGCALGAATALVEDWRSLRRLLDRAANRAGLDIPACTLPDEESVAQAIKAGADTPGAERALAFGSEQLLLQHRALFDLLEARAEARQD